ncbi:MAG: alkaline phosphatase family protein [Candidatus Omnitrophica bacterium]|nr:alkaline phosphatase family protein [Candidatus Omnitrophota bacterium]MBI3083363.1 alkaline phosphatase family protein [Candidatus Omnitrophota bacterium]
MIRQNFRAATVWATLALCAPAVAQEPTVRTVVVNASQAWTDTGIEVQPGTLLHVEAEGAAWVMRPRLWERLTGWSTDRRVGPQGTYLWPEPFRSLHQQPRSPFPLPAMADGPYPAFALIGKIGALGDPFYIGARYDGVAAEAGRLWLGINDHHPEDNRGHFTAQIALASSPKPPVSVPSVVEPGSRLGRPLPGARVLLLYIDGLRPDVLQEMAEAGFLPNLKRAFLDQGLAIPHAFTVFPSNTLIANGSLFTGLFSDRTGIKSQHQFERSTRKPKGSLSAWLPDGPQSKTRVINLLDKYAPETTHTFLVKRGIPTLASRLGKAFKFTTLPIAPLNPPPQWLHLAINTLGPFGISTRLPARLDEVNAAYAIEELLGDPDGRVIAIWFPMADKTSHHSGRGQFGSARRDLAFADRFVGRILARLREVGWDRSTYLILLSDHGHLGGETSVNQRCNLARDWAHRTLGCNVHVVGQEWTHPGLDADRFLFFDTQGAGQAKLFLPYGSYFHGAWRRNRFFELTHYELGPGRVAVNLLDSVTGFRPPGWDAQGGPPIDLILVKLDARRVFVYRDGERQAIIHRLEDSFGQEVYRYEPIRHLTQSADGALHSEPPLPGLDPLGYLQDAAFLAYAGSPGWLDAPHTASEWLSATHQTRYPDAVVTMAKFFAWQRPVEDLAEVRDPDLVVTAAAGWSLRSDDGEGTDHGYPLHPSMRISLFLAGPNVVHGTLPAPQRIVDVLPTVLEMVGWPYDPTQLDGKAITGIYE